MNISEQILSIAKEDFNDTKLQLTSKLKDAAGYDSMAHVQFLINLESFCNTSFNDDEIKQNSTIQDVLNIITKKCG